MTRNEIQDLMTMIQAAYPNYNPQNKTAAVNVWAIALEEYDKDDVALAFKIYIKSNSSGFAPSPGQIIEKIQMTKEPEELNEMEAWSLVSKAIRNSGYHAVEEFKKLPPLVQKAVGMPEQLQAWALDESYSEEVNSSNFIKCYKTVVKRQKEIKRMPEEIKSLIDYVNQDSLTVMIEQKNKQTVERMEKAKRMEEGPREQTKEYSGIEDMLNAFRKNMEEADC